MFAERSEEEIVTGKADLSSKLMTNGALPYGVANDGSMH